MYILRVFLKTVITPYFWLFIRPYKFKYVENDLNKKSTRFFHEINEEEYFVKICHKTFSIAVFKSAPELRETSVFFVLKLCADFQ